MNNGRSPSYNLPTGVFFDRPVVYRQQTITAFYPAWRQHSSKFNPDWGTPLTTWSDCEARRHNFPIHESYRPPAFSIALIIIFLASSPDRLVTVKCATDWRRRIFVFASTEISLICIAIRGALRSMILISLSRRFSFATFHLQKACRSSRVE